VQNRLLSGSIPITPLHARRLLFSVPLPGKHRIRAGFDIEILLLKKTGIDKKIDKKILDIHSEKEYK
jgi:hypothetical protein